MISVFLPTQLDSYTEGMREVVFSESELPKDHMVLADVIRALDQRYPGVAFRLVDEHQKIRRHIAIFLGDTMVRTLDVSVSAGSRVQIVGALSGG